MTEAIGAVLDRLEAQETLHFQLRPGGNSLEFLQLVYRNSSLDLHIRMRAAMAALKHEVPALLATAIVNEGSFAELLDRRLAKMQEMKLIEAKPTPDKVIEASKVDVKPPMAHTNDKRFRRL